MSVKSLVHGMAMALFVVGVTAQADDQKTSVKVDGVNAHSGDTSILIKKGDVSVNQCVEYQIVDGVEEITGDPGMTKTVAHKNWKTACADWKTQTKELNPGAKSSLLTLNCGSATAAQDGDNWTYHSSGKYKLKVKTREKN